MIYQDFDDSTDLKKIKISTKSHRIFVVKRPIT